MTAQRSLPLIGAGAFCLLAAAVVPQETLTGVLDADDFRNLRTGAQIWRAAMAALGAFCVLTGWLTRREPATASDPWPEATSGPTGQWKPLLAITAVGALLRLNHLDRQLWFDEMWMVVDYIRHGLGTVVRTYPSDNNHPMYTLLAWFSVDAFGEHPWTLRLPAYAFGVASITMLGVFADRYCGRLVALVSAAVLALSFHHVSFTQNARGYTGLLFFALLSTHWFLDAIRTGRRKAWVATGIALACGMWLHLTMVFVALGQAAWLIINIARLKLPAGSARVRACVLAFVFGALLTIVLYALILPQMADYLVGQPNMKVAEEAAWTNPLWLLEQLALTFGMGRAVGFVLLASGALVFLFGLRASGRKTPAVPAILMLSGAISAMTYLGLGRNLWPRLFFFLAGFAIIVVVAGVLEMARIVAGWIRIGDAVRRTRLLTAAAATVVILGALATLPRAWHHPKQDYDAAREWVKSEAGDDPVIVVGMAILPYTDYRPSGFLPVSSIEEWESTLPVGRKGWVISTFPIYMQSRQPDLWRAIQDRVTRVVSFPAGIGDGDVTVFRVE